MTRSELLAITAFVEKSRFPLPDWLGLREPDAVFRIVLFLMSQHLRNRPVTVSSLAAASGVPYATAMRRINEMFDAGLIVKRPKTKTGRSFYLYPSKELIVRFQEFALRIKVLVGETFGFAVPDPSRFFFGGSYMAARIISKPEVLTDGPAFGKTVRMLVCDEPAFRAMGAIREVLAQLLGGRLLIRQETLDRLRVLALENARQEMSEFDIVAFDLPWIAEFHDAGVMLPLDDLIADSDMNPFDFHPTGWDAAQYKGMQLGIPIQTMPELLFYRKDLLADAGLLPPKTTEQVLHAASVLHDPRREVAGIAWNAARGTPVGQTFIQVLGAFGRPPLALAATDGDYDVSEISGDALRPTINTVPGRLTAEYLLQLLEYSPPGILQMDWDRRVEAFAKGHSAMAYAWSCRAARFELSPTSPARGKVGYLPHPHGPGATNVSPVGGIVLGIPANLDPGRLTLAWQVIELLTSPELFKVLANNGSPVSPRFSVSADPEVTSKFSVIAAVDEMARAGQLHLWPRPPVREFAQIIAVLGEEIHDMLRGGQTVRRALLRSQQRIDRNMRAHGHY